MDAKIEELKAEYDKQDSLTIYVVALEAIKYAETLSAELSAIRGATDEELALIGERFQCAETEFHRIQAYKDLEAATISRGQRIRELEKSPRVIDDDHLYGDQEVYYGILHDSDSECDEDPVTKLVANVDEEGVYLSDEYATIRNIDEFDFVVGPFKPKESTNG